MSAFNKQVGGDHYKNMPIGPTEYCQVNEFNACESQAIIYLSRHRSKGGRLDLEKAKHLIDMIIELEYQSADDPGEKVGYFRRHDDIKPGDLFPDQQEVMYGVRSVGEVLRENDIKPERVEAYGCSLSLENLSRSE